jgi:hypothetical protein
MYFRIEIGHPVYCILLYDLLVSLLSSGINLLILPWIPNFKYDTMAVGSNALGVLFHSRDRFYETPFRTKVFEQIFVLK